MFILQMLQPIVACVASHFARAIEIKDDFQLVEKKKKKLNHDFVDLEKVFN